MFELTQIEAILENKPKSSTYRSLDDMSISNSKGLFQELQPIHWSMHAIGLLFHKTKSWTAMYLLTLVYHIIVLLGLWGMVIRSFWIYELSEPFGVHLMIKICTHVFGFQSAISTSVATKVSVQITQFFTDWENYRKTYHSPSCIITQFRKRCLVATTLCWIVAFLVTVNEGREFWDNRSYIANILFLPISNTMIIKDIPVHFKVGMILYLLYMYLATFLFLTYFTLLCTGLKYD